MKTKLRTYLTSHNQCFIPRCQARCCTNAPLPEGYLPKFKSRIVREPFAEWNMGQNDPRDKFNSILYNTTRNPIQLLGYDQNGRSIAGIPPHVLESMQIQSMEEINRLVASYDQYDNYCPFLTEHGRCNVYDHRPQICRDFGSTALKVDQCHEKSSRLDIAKFYVKQFFNFKENFKIIKEAIKAKYFNK